ncbi:ElyC/SanA/YdcF family protein [Acrocarpospora macrocephala]|uniref:Membrane protein n=1 Tax=Acrocarpospora macrocephala TaxID=150177 RepID=A0A5M3X155_9ACTN|nr:ElyC/SanA/YdcF family protein [Acrocarpospora macrocephala]GES14884.1 membrane protein [Acrocarpospora macrocephala]
MKRLAFQVAVGLSVLAIAPMTWAWLVSSPYRTDAVTRDWVERVPAAPVALVLGAGIWGDHPTPMLGSRLDIATTLYAQGKIKAILVSGDNHIKAYDEPTVMRDYLIAKGVPKDKIVLDYAGFDTWDSCVRAKKIFGASAVTVVTQSFHLPRAVTLCRTAGLEAYGVGDDSSQAFRGTTYVYAAREFFASGKGFLDAVILRSDPQFLGRYETSLDQAIASG